MPPKILTVNPWITDFAAYNLWLKPLGLLWVAGLLRRNGFLTSLVDFTYYTVKTNSYGDSKFLKAKIDKPIALKSIPRNYSQYGIPEEMLLKRLSQHVEPDLICVTSGMTYWYPGVSKAIEIIRMFFKNTPVILGGIYATLCYEHAKKHSGADIVFEGRGDTEIVKLISELTGFESEVEEFRNPQSAVRNRNYPAFDLYPDLDYICISTSTGCPYKCAYCASALLAKGFSRRDPMDVVEEIEYWTSNFRIDNIAFYDDALLVNPSTHFIPLMEKVIRKGIHCNFHTPNAIHVREIDEKVADLLYRGGFKTIRLGFETSNETIQIETGAKVDNQSFRWAVGNLRRAGYESHEIGVYLMVGLPEQRVGDIEESIAFVKTAGAKPILVEYSPIPRTPLFEKAKKISPFDLENEPLYHNNSLIPCQWEGFTMTDYQRLKSELRG